MVNLFYRNIKGEITYGEFLQEYNKLMNIKKSRKMKKKWTHPLNKEKYRKRFNLPER